MTEYLLPRHVHFCVRGDAFVFLDLRRDEYSMINGRAADALRASFDPDAPAQSAAERSTALRELLDAGLLTTDVSSGRPIAPTTVPLAAELLVEPEATLAPRITPAHAANFVTACALAAVRLRCYRLERTITIIEQRKARWTGGATVELDVEKARELCAIFHTLRSFFPRNYLCLYDSLALIEFLARYSVFPTWVFGVVLEPWGAHCWVQEGPFAFNEDVEEAASYTPVMAV